MLPKLLAPSAYQDNPELVEFVREMMLETSEDGVVGALAALRDRPDSFTTLSEIDVPTLIIHGADDQIIPLTESQAMHEAITNSQLVIIPDAGHLMNLEQPDLFNDAVREFLESL